MRASRDGANRASISGGSCRRDSTRTPRLIVWNPWRQRVGKRAGPGVAPGKAAGQLHHEARVDAVLAGRNAIAAAAASLAPAHRLGIALAAGDQIDDGAGGRARISVADAGRPGHRAGAKAIAAPGAGIGDRRAARPEGVEETVSLDRPAHPVPTSLVLSVDHTQAAGKAALHCASRRSSLARGCCGSPAQPMPKCMAALLILHWIVRCYKLLAF